MTHQKTNSRGFDAIHLWFTPTPHAISEPALLIIKSSTFSSCPLLRAGHKQALITLPRTPRPRSRTWMPKSFRAKQVTLT